MTGAAMVWKLTFQKRSNSLRSRVGKPEPASRRGCTSGWLALAVGWVMTRSLRVAGRR